MKNFLISGSCLAVILLGFLSDMGAIASPQSPANVLGGTSWQLVKFLGSDDKSLRPEDKSRYTIAFEANGGVSVRIDCNRGHGSWTSAGPNQLEFGPLALTRAMCPAAPLNDRLAKDWQYARSYLLKDGHLFLSLMADGGTYEFEPFSPESMAAAHIRGSAAYRERMALPASAVFEAALEDISRTDVPAEMIGHTRIEHPGNPPITFEIAYDPARINPNRSYSVRARITVADQLIFTTTESYPVLTRGNGNQVTLLLQRTTGQAGNETTHGGVLSGLPATFLGTLPCADCPGIRYQLDLYPDHTFFSRMTYEDRSSRFDSNGRWELSADGRVLMLHGARATTEKFSVNDADTLRKLDSEGKQIDSKLNYDLQRAATFAPIEGTSNLPLENTSWKLTKLGEASISAGPSEKDVYFVLDSENHRVAGSGGCNRLMGGYEVNGEQLRFKQMASTMMACPQGMDVEKAFLEMLGEVSTWKITRHSLELFNASGNPIAGLEGRPGQ